MAGNSLSPVCGHRGCDRRIKARGWCEKHYARWVRNGHTELLPKAAPRRKECSVDGCPDIVHAHGLCSKHAHRLARHGNPLTIKRAPPGKAMQWIREHANYQGDDCLDWPFAKGGGGYGTIRHEGRAKAANRVMCIVAHGDPPEDGMCAAHSCGNGLLGCVNPKHLSWKTISENYQDAVEHGTAPIGEKSSNAKLTEKQVLKIRALQGVKSQREIAEEFGICRATVSAVHRRVNWAWLD